MLSVSNATRLYINSVIDRDDYQFIVACFDHSDNPFNEKFLTLFDYLSMTTDYTKIGDPEKSPNNFSNRLEYRKSRFSAKLFLSLKYISTAGLMHIITLLSRF